MSDLGGGKTTFARGLARGFGSKDRVASPTFTISRVYKAGPKAMYHFDFYRLPEPGLIAEELAEVAGDPLVVTVVEWANIVQDVLPVSRLTVEMHKTPEDERELTFRYPASLQYVMEGLA